MNTWHRFLHAIGFCFPCNCGMVWRPWYWRSYRARGWCYCAYNIPCDDCGAGY